jgi:hypothetical protein
MKQKKLHVTSRYIVLHRIWWLGVRFSINTDIFKFYDYTEEV